MLLQNTRIDLNKYYQILKRNNTVFTQNIDNVLVEAWRRRNDQKERTSFWKQAKTWDIPYPRVASKRQINVETTLTVSVYDQFEIYNRLRIIYIDPLIVINSFMHNPTTSGITSDDLEDFRCCFAKLVTQPEIDIISKYTEWYSSSEFPDPYENRYGLGDIFILPSYVSYTNYLFDIVGLLLDNRAKWLYNGGYMVA